MNNLIISVSVSLWFHQGFSDTRHGDVVLVRPMRDYSAKEIAYYNHVFAVPSVFIPGLDTKVKSSSHVFVTEDVGLVQQGKRV